MRDWFDSFRGGVGACADGEDTEGKAGSSTPSGPNGSSDPSTVSNRVGCAPILRAGSLREAGDLGGLVGCVLGCEEVVGESAATQKSDLLVQREPLDAY